MEDKKIPLPKLKTTFMDGPALLIKTEYKDGGTALILRDPLTDEMLSVATVNLPSHKCKLMEGQVFIKNWSENEGMLEALQAAGVIGPVLEEVPTGFVKAQRVQVLV